MYPKANPGLRSIFHCKISTQITEELNNNLEQVQIMWSRDGNLDMRPNALFQPTHFVPILVKEQMKRDLTVKKLPAERDISSLFKPAYVNTPPMVNKATKFESSGLKRKK